MPQTCALNDRLEIIAQIRESTIKAAGKHIISVAVNVRAYFVLAIYAFTDRGLQLHIH